MIGADKEGLTGKGYTEFAPLNALSSKLTEAIRTAVEDFELIFFNQKHLEVFILPYRGKDDTVFVRIVFKDISNFVNLEKELIKRNKELIIINTLSGAFISSENIDLVVENLMTKVLMITDFGMGWLLIMEDGRFRLKSSKGISPVFIKDIQAGELDIMCEDIIRQNEPIYIVESSDIKKNDALRREAIAFLTAIPLIYNNSITGILFLASRGTRDRHFDFDFASLLSLVGNHMSLIIEKIKLFQETERLSITDGLTELFNTRYFYKQLDLEIARTDRYGNSFSLILLDIDNFKQLNDTYGHQAGDDILHEFAKILKTASRETDIVVRYGGEEFIIILPNTSEEDTISLAERIRSNVEKNLFLINHTVGIHVTVSGGISSYPQNADNSKSLLNAADTALYSAKASGKNRILCFKGKIHG